MLRRRLASRNGQTAESEGLGITKMARSPKHRRTRPSSPSRRQVDTRPSAMPATATATPMALSMSHSLVDGPKLKRTGPWLDS